MQTSDSNLGSVEYTFIFQIHFQIKTWNVETD